MPTTGTGGERRWWRWLPGRRLKLEPADRGASDGAPGEPEPPAARRERGFALVVGLVAMTALTIMGVAAVTASSIDLKIIHNMRRAEQARYASIAGLEHARRQMILGVMPDDDQTVYFDQIEVTPDYFVTAPDSKVMTSGDGKSLGTYSVTAVLVKCGGPPAGYSVDLFYSQFYDLRSQGVLEDSSGKEISPATATTALTVRKVQDGRCFKR